MNLLLETHPNFGLVAGPPDLSATTSAALADPANDGFLRAASIREQAIKPANPNQRLVRADPLALSVARWSSADQIQELSIEMRHAARLAGSLVEGMTSVSRNEKLAAYPVSVLW